MNRVKVDFFESRGSKIHGPRVRDNVSVSHKKRPDVYCI